jgi:hypothetical protein
LGIASGAFGGRKCSKDFADCDADGFGRARGGLAQQMLELGELESVVRSKADRRLGNGLIKVTLDKATSSAAVTLTG